MEDYEKFLQEMLWRKDQAYRDLACDYYRLQIEFEELSENFDIIYRRLQNQQDGDYEETDD